MTSLFTYHCLISIHNKCRTPELYIHTASQASMLHELSINGIMRCGDNSPLQPN